MCGAPGAPIVCDEKSEVGSEHTPGGSCASKGYNLAGTRPLTGNEREKKASGGATIGCDNIGEMGKSDS